jgi:transcriptional regulator with XRE-family HTH domain
MRKFSPKKVKKRRNELNFTQTDLAKRIKEPKQRVDTLRIHIADIERGEHDPRSSMIAKLADSLKVSESYFFEGTRKYELVDEEIEESSSEQVLRELNVDLHEKERAVIVVVDDISDQENSFFDRALTLMHGVRKVISVPKNKQEVGV